MADEDRAQRLARLRDAAVRVDGDDRVVGVVKALRRRLPGDDRFGDERSGDQGRPLLEAATRSVDLLGPDRRSAAQELGMGALQVWQALSERAGRGRGDADVAILFTDLVGFSSWALDAGDDNAVELLRLVARCTDTSVTRCGGTIVKQLGDGAMAVFTSADDAAQAALTMHDELDAAEVAGHRPLLRAGLHQGRPRRLGGDFLGVDVNVAARTAEAAKGGRLLVTEPTATHLDHDVLEVGRARKLKAAGTPDGLRVCEVRRR